MASRIRIAIDCMGGDHGLRTSLPAVHKALQQFPDLDILLVGDQSLIEAGLAGVDASRVEILHAADTVTMADKPSVALRKKPESSMRLAIDSLENGRVDAVVSAGNTGALMAIGCYVLKTLPGIDRPAICSALPTAKGPCHLLDLGANVDCSAENLYQFALMGAALASAVDANQQAKIALLNIGEEDIKGNERVKDAAGMLEADANLCFVGSIEGDHLFDGEVDVVVCDGFVGNVALKVCEGTAAHIAGLIRQQFEKNWLTRLVAGMAIPVLRPLYRTLDPQQYNGASFLGLRGVVVKSHGNSSAASFVQAIATARAQVQFNLQGLIEQRLAILSDFNTLEGER